MSRSRAGPRRADPARLAILAALCALILPSAQAQESRGEGDAVRREEVIHAALEWVKRHQNPDGSWGAATFTARCDTERGARCTGAGKTTFDVGVTGLAILAFLGAGYDSQRPGPYLETVRNGLKSLKRVQDAQGCFGPTDDPKHASYGHAIATIAMCEGYASSKQLPWRKSAEQAVGYIALCQNPYKAWRYGKQPGDNDSSVTCWMLRALFSARAAGMPVRERSVMDAIAVLDSLTDETTGKTGYIKKGEQPAHGQPVDARPPRFEDSPTAGATWARIAFGLKEPALTEAGAAFLQGKTPVWDESKGPIDMDWWYWASLAMPQLGGTSGDRWKEALLKLAIEHQVPRGCAEGSWDPKGDWGEEGGRVYSTAIMTLCLEAPYRSREGLAWWNEAARRRDSYVFVDYAVTELEAHIGRLVAAKAELVVARSAIEQTAAANSRSTELTNEALQALRAAFQTARDWPVSIGGREYSESELIDKVDVLLQGKHACERWGIQLAKELDRSSAKAEDVAKMIVESKSKLGALMAWREARFKGDTRGDVDKLLDEVHDLLLRNDAYSRRTSVSAVEGTPIDGPADPERQEMGPSAREFLTGKPDSRK